jgi:hypothetical protein
VGLWMRPGPGPGGIDCCVGEVLHSDRGNQGCLFSGRPANKVMFRLLVTGPPTPTPPTQTRAAACFLHRPSATRCGAPSNIRTLVHSHPRTAAAAPGAAVSDGGCSGRSAAPQRRWQGACAVRRRRVGRGGGGRRAGQGCSPSRQRHNGRAGDSEQRVRTLAAGMHALGSPCRARGHSRLAILFH